MKAPMNHLPLGDEVDLESPEVLRQAARSHRALAELKGALRAIPNAEILISTISIQEARDSSTIENIVTTQDEVYRSAEDDTEQATPAAKEVHRYVRALKQGFALIEQNGFLRISDIMAIHETLCRTNTGFRKLPGTVLRNSVTQEVVYEPPQDPREIERLMDNFLEWFHATQQWGIDPLVQMAVLHYQFESIHPFYDGNGRTGRILNLLHLIRNELLSVPVLYLSRAIVRNKADYYRHLQGVREEAGWEPWILYMLQAVESTAQQTLTTVNAITELMHQTKHRLRSEHPRVYSQELLANLFRHPYTKIDHIMRDCSVSRPTAMKYLSTLESVGILRKEKVGRINYYVHEQLLRILL
jgi:Fic family protein